MPFAVFRRHQRKLLAIFAILAMFGFVLSDSLPRLLSSSTSAGDQKVVATLYGKSVYRSRPQRDGPAAEPRQPVHVRRSPSSCPASSSADSSDRDLVDALILQHEADRLGIPADARDRPRVAQADHRRPDEPRALRDVLFSRFRTRSAASSSWPTSPTRSGSAKVRQLLGSPVVTPLDVFRAYRDQNERSAPGRRGPRRDVPRQGPRAVRGRGPGPLRQVQGRPARPRPRHARLQGPPPGPGRDPLDRRQRPGRGIKDKLTEAELRSYYENHKSEFEVPSELPERPVRRPARADPPDRPAVRRGPGPSWPPGWPRRRPRPRSSTSSTRSRTRR